VYGLQFLIRSSTVDSRKFTGHCISFVQDSVTKLSAKFNSWKDVVDDVVKNITVVFVGKRADYETWKDKRVKTFQVSSKKILRYYQALSVIFGPDICEGRPMLSWSAMEKLGVAGLEAISARLDSLHEEISEATIHCESEALLEEILKVGSSVATANESGGKGYYSHILSIHRFNSLFFFFFQ
jgi:hypothetical protein